MQPCGLPRLRPHARATDGSIAKGDSDNAIFHDFRDQYGPVVLAAPMFTRFNHLAWIVPPLVLFLGIGGAMLIMRKWKFHTVPLPRRRGWPVTRKSAIAYAARLSYEQRAQITVRNGIEP